MILLYGVTFRKNGTAELGTRDNCFTATKQAPVVNSILISRSKFFCVSRKIRCRVSLSPKQSYGHTQNQFFSIKLFGCTLKITFKKSRLHSNLFCSSWHNLFVLFSTFKGVFVLYRTINFKYEKHLKFSIISKCNFSVQL